MNSDCVPMEIPAWQLRPSDNLILDGLAFEIISIFRSGELVHVLLDAEPFRLRRSFQAAEQLEIAR